MAVPIAAIRQHALLRPLVYLLGLFRFPVNQAAPLGTYTETSRAGSLTVTDTESRLAVSANAIRFTPTATPAWNTEGVNSANLTRAARPLMLVDINLSAGNTTLVGMTRTATVNNGGFAGVAHAFYITTLIQIVENLATAGVTVLTALVFNTTYRFVIIPRSAGAFYFVTGGTLAGGNTDYILAAVGVNDSTAAEHATWSNNAATGAIEQVAAIAAPYPWNDDYAGATDRKATSASGDTLTTTADAIIEHTFTAATGVTKRIMFRYLDDNNTWICDCDQTNSTVKLIERNASVETTRSSVAQTWTNGTSYRVCIDAYGAQLYSRVGVVQKNSYATATFQQTQTGAKVDHAGTNFIAWPKRNTFPTLVAGRMPLNLTGAGDSIMFGTAATGSLGFFNVTVSTLLTNLTPTSKWTNLGVGGYTWLDLTTNAATTDTYYSTLYKKNILVLFCGTNDIAGGADGATTYARALAYCQARQAAGWLIVIVTMLPRGDATFEAKRVIYNNLVAANWQTFADAYYPAHLDANIGVASANTNLTYYNADQVHPINAGHAIIATGVTAAISTLL